MALLKEVQLELYHLDIDICPIIYAYDRLVSINLPFLMYRRRRMNMIMMYKILHALDGVPFEDLVQYHFLIQEFLPPIKTVGNSY